MYSSGYPSFSSLPVLLFLPEAHLYPANCRGLQRWRQWGFPSYIRRKMISTATAATSATSLDTLAQLRRAGSCEQTRSQLLKWLLLFSVKYQLTFCTMAQESLPVQLLAWFRKFQQQGKQYQRQMGPWRLLLTVDSFDIWGPASLTLSTYKPHMCYYFNFMSHHLSRLSLVSHQ